LQSVSFVLAALIGSFWTWHIYQSQREAEKSQGQLTKLTREIEILKAEPRLEIDIETKSLKVPGSSDRYVVGRINVKNVGSAETVLHVKNEPVNIYAVTPSEGLTVTAHGLEVWAPVSSLHLQTGPNVVTENLTCQVGATKNSEFITSLPSPGLYVVTFSVPRNAAETRAAKSLGAIPTGPQGRIEWQAQHYFMVE